MQKIRAQYDNITLPDIQHFMAYQPILALMECGTTHNSKDYYLARENCPYAILFYCTDGQGEIIHQGKSLYFYKDDTIIMPASTSHILVSHPEHPFIAKWINVSGNAVDNLLNTYGIFAPAVFTGVDTQGLIESYHSTLSSSLEPQEVVSSSVLLLTAIVHACVLPTLPQADAQNRVAQMIKTCIDHHIQDHDLSVSKVADMLSMPLFKVTKVFQQAYGIGPHTYITHKRINNSKLLLRSTTLPIKTIAETMGFTDSTYFFHFFKKHTGVSPSKFRKCEGQHLSDNAD